MDEQTSWKGHSFTLLVFAGIVVLCSIFFILGMLVGRTQGQKIAGVAAAATAAKNEEKSAPEDKKPDLTFYDSVEKEKRPALALERPPAPVVTAAPEPPPKRADPKPSPRIFNYQIAALRKSSEAEKLLDDLKKKGFKTFILEPAATDADPYFRVQVGPFTDVIEAGEAKKKLEEMRYKPILKK